MTAPAIRVSDLSLRYAAKGPSAAHTALRGVSLDVAAGGVLGVLGESGSGKTTLVRLLSGTASANRRGESPARIVGGDATVLQTSLRGVRKRQLNQLTFAVGYLEQDAGNRLPPSLTVSDIVSAPIFDRDKRYNARGAGQRVATVLDAVRLPLSVLAQYPYELSSGQRQRVALARAVVLGPSVLIADEPTAGIDATVRHAVIELIQQLQTEATFSAVLVSHDVSVLQALTTQVAVLHRGRLVGLGPFDELLAAPSHPYVASLASALAHPADGE